MGNGPRVTRSGLQTGSGEAAAVEGSQKVVKAGCLEEVTLPSYQDQMLPGLHNFFINFIAKVFANCV